MGSRNDQAGESNDFIETYPQWAYSKDGENNNDEGEDYIEIPKGSFDIRIDQEDIALINRYTPNEYGSEKLSDFNGDLIYNLQAGDTTELTIDKKQLELFHQFDRIHQDVRRGANTEGKRELRVLSPFTLFDSETSLDNNKSKNNNKNINNTDENNYNYRTTDISSSYSDINNNCSNSRSLPFPLATIFRENALTECIIEEIVGDDGNVINECIIEEIYENVKDKSLLSIKDADVSRHSKIHQEDLEEEEEEDKKEREKEEEKGAEEEEKEEEGEEEEEEEEEEVIEEERESKEELKEEEEQEQGEEEKEEGEEGQKGVKERGEGEGQRENKIQDEAKLADGLLIENEKIVGDINDKASKSWIDEEWIRCEANAQVEQILIVSERSGDPLNMDDDHRASDEWGDDGSGNERSREENEGTEEEEDALHKHEAEEEKENSDKNISEEEIDEYLNEFFGEDEDDLEAEGDKESCEEEDEVLKSEEKSKRRDACQMESRDFESSDEHNVEDMDADDAEEDVEPSYSSAHEPSSEEKESNSSKHASEGSVEEHEDEERERDEAMETSEMVDEEDRDETDNQEMEERDDENKEDEQEFSQLESEVVPPAESSEGINEDAELSLDLNNDQEKSSQGASEKSRKERSSRSKSVASNSKTGGSKKDISKAKSLSIRDDEKGGNSRSSSRASKKNEDVGDQNEETGTANNTEDVFSEGEFSELDSETALTPQSSEAIEFDGSSDKDDEEQKSWRSVTPPTRPAKKARSQSTMSNVKVDRGEREVRKARSLSIKDDEKDRAASSRSNSRASSRHPTLDESMEMESENQDESEYDKEDENGNDIFSEGPSIKGDESQNSISSVGASSTKGKKSRSMSVATFGNADTRKKDVRKARSLSIKDEGKPGPSRSSSKASIRHFVSPEDSEETEQKDESNIREESEEGKRDASEKGSNEQNVGSANCTEDAFSEGEFSQLESEMIFSPEASEAFEVDDDNQRSIHSERATSRKEKTPRSQSVVLDNSKRYSGRKDVRKAKSLSIKDDDVAAGSRSSSRASMHPAPSQDNRENESFNESVEELDESVISERVEDEDLMNSQPSFSRNTVEARSSRTLKRHTSFFRQAAHEKSISRHGSEDVHLTPPDHHSVRGSTSTDGLSQDEARRSGSEAINEDVVLNEDVEDQDDLFSQHDDVESIDAVHDESERYSHFDHDASESIHDTHDFSQNDISEAIPSEAGSNAMNSQITAGVGGSVMDEQSRMESDREGRILELVEVTEIHLNRGASLEGGESSLDAEGDRDEVSTVQGAEEEEEEVEEESRIDLEELIVDIDEGNDVMRITQVTKIEQQVAKQYGGESETTDGQRITQKRKATKRASSAPHSRGKMKKEPKPTTGSDTSAHGSRPKKKFPDNGERAEQDFRYRSNRVQYALNARLCADLREARDLTDKLLTGRPVKIVETALQSLRERNDLIRSADNSTSEQEDYSDDYFPDICVDETGHVVHRTTSAKKKRNSIKSNAPSTSRRRSFSNSDAAVDDEWTDDDANDACAFHSLRGYFDKVFARMEKTIDAEADRLTVGRGRQRGGRVGEGLEDFKYKTHYDQHTFNTRMIEKLEEVVRLMDQASLRRAARLLRNVIGQFENRNRIVCKEDSLATNYASDTSISSHTMSSESSDDKT